MKLYIMRDGAGRCYAATLRNCLTDKNAPRACPVRKCRRDGVCSGPLMRRGEDGMRLVRNDCADLASDDVFAPVCYPHLPDAVKRSVEAVFHSHCRALSAAYNASMRETTRVIASRRWRRVERSS